MYITEDAVLTSVWLTWACSNYETADANCPQQLIQQQKLIQQNKKDTHGSPLWLLQEVNTIAVARNYQCTQ